MFWAQCTHTGGNYSEGEYTDWKVRQDKNCHTDPVQKYLACTLYIPDDYGHVGQKAERYGPKTTTTEQDRNWFMHFTDDTFFPLLKSQ